MDVARYRLIVVGGSTGDSNPSKILPGSANVDTANLLRPFVSPEEPLTLLATPHPPLHRHCSPSLFRLPSLSRWATRGGRDEERPALPNALRHAGMIFTHNAIEFNELFVYSFARRERDHKTVLPATWTRFCLLSRSACAVSVHHDATPTASLSLPLPRPRPLPPNRSRFQSSSLRVHARGAARSRRLPSLLLLFFFMAPGIVNSSGARI